MEDCLAISAHFTWPWTPTVRW